MPEEDWVKQWARTNGVAFDFKQLCETNAELKKAISTDMMKLAAEKKLSSLEKPREFILWPELCSVENDLLTSTFKMKRNVAKDRFMP
jgi:long-subunit acyl-CoA synthetase (AMP-forming)